MAAAASDSIGPEALRQIQVLLADKAARTPVQRKIDSNLIYAARMSRGMPVVAGLDALQTGVDVASDGQTVVDITAWISSPLLAAIQEAGATILDARPRDNSIRARVPIGALEAIAGFHDVVFIQPGQLAFTVGGGKSSGLALRAGFRADVGRVSAKLRKALGEKARPLRGESAEELDALSVSEGDRTHRADLARSTFGVSGAGVKIGVLSDGVDSLALLRLTGDLPFVSVLPGQAGAGDEGTAMLEIVHDLAPNAQLYFATAFTSITSFAQNIRDLRAAGCDIIVDDVFYTEETPMQAGQAVGIVSNTNGGILTQAVNDVAADGALYFSAAGNDGNKDGGTASVWEGDFADGGSAGAVFGEPGRLHDFGGGTTYDTLTSDSLVVSLFWADPLGGSVNDYDLFVLDYSGSTVLASSTNFQTGSQDPNEEIASTSFYGTRVAIVKFSGAGRFLHLNAVFGGLSVNTSGQIRGHAAATNANAYGVAATPAVSPGPYPNPFNSSNVLETFSSDGPRRYFFNGDGIAITPGNFSSSGGAVVQQPRLTAADGVSTLFFPFYGTSAAAPHAAAIAALVKSANPSFTAAQVGNFLTSTAIDIMGPGFDRDSGNGILDAYAAVQATAAGPKAFLTIGTVTATEDGANGNGVVEPGECGQLAVQLVNGSGSVSATGISATLSTSTPGVTIDTPTLAYPDLAGGATGTLPFPFHLSPGVACPLEIDFALMVTFSGGLSPVSLTFSIRIGPAAITTSLDTTSPPIFPGVFSTATGLQTNRIFRTGYISACGSPKFFPGTVNSGSLRYDAYTFVNCGPTACLTINVGSPGGKLFSAAYRGSFNPGNIGTNFVADAGGSGQVMSYPVTVAAGATLVVVVSEISAGAGIGTNYSLWVDGMCLGCATYPDTHCCAAIALSPATLPAGIAKSPYPPTTLMATGGTGSYAFTMPELPPGMTATTSPSSVTLGGTPTAAFFGTITVSGTDTGGCPFSKMYSLTINCPAPPSTVITAAPQICPLSAGNTASVPDAGGGATYAWTISNGTITSGAGTRTITYTAGSSGLVSLGVTVTATPGCPTPGSTTIKVGCASFYTVTPCRVADTRDSTGSPSLVANAVRTFQVAFNCGIPSSAKAVAVNLAVVTPSNSGDLRVYPAGGAVPLASAINFRSGIVRANNAIIPLSASGQISVQCDMPSGGTNFFFDVFGYFQ
jgi:hypothetical protein